MRLMVSSSNTRESQWQHRKFKVVARVGIILLTGLIHPCRAEMNLKPSFSAELGRSVVDGILLPELDTFVEGQDQAMFWRFDAGVQSRLSAQSQLDFGLSSFNESYQTNSDYDLSLLSYYADYQYELNALSVGVQWQESHVDLGGQAFMQQRNMNSYASYPFNPQYLLFGSLAFDSKTLADFADRDSQGWHADLQLFAFPQAGHSVYWLGVGSSTEQAEDSTFNNKEWRLQSGYRRYGEWFGKSTQFDIGLHYDKSDYAEYWQQNQQRKDQHRQFYCEFMLVANAHVSPKIALFHDKYQSTLAEFTFSESTIQLSLQFSL